jgi:Xaa-Pro aminopeptidase
MRVFASSLALASVLAFCGVSWAAAPAIPLSEFKQRRDALRKALPDATVVLVGGAEDERGALRTGFFQDADFYYVTGWTEPGAALMISHEGDTLFLPERSEIRERYTGPKGGPGDPGIEERTGFDRVLKIQDLKGRVPKDGDVYGFKAQESEIGRPIKDVVLPLARLRMVKSAGEVAAIQWSTDVTMEAQKKAWATMASGMNEYEIAAAITNTYYSQGCERNAFAPIVGSGPKGATLHYSANKRRIDNGELVLMDVGAECNWYATDITRTVPANGRFTERQRELYEIVWKAQQAAIDAAKPGVMLRGGDGASLDKIARDYINSHGKDLHGDPLGKYFTHSLGHHVGLDVHDATDPELKLAPGMVITIEPGLYIPEEQIGIRIEDMVLITEDGARVMTEALPRDPDEIERWMQQNGR